MWILCLFLILIIEARAGRDQDRVVTCRIRCRTTMEELAPVVKGSAQFYLGGFCGLETFFFEPQNAKVGISSRTSDTPAAPFFSVRMQSKATTKGLQQEPVFVSFPLNKGAEVIHSKTYDGGLGLDGEPQKIDVQCIWGYLPHPKEFSETFVVDGKKSVLVPPLKMIERDPVFCEKLTPLPIRLPTLEFGPILSRVLQGPVAQALQSPAFGVPDETVVDAVNGVQESTYVYPPEEKQQILDALPKLDMGMCKWGCENREVHHAILWNIPAIVESFKKTQALRYAKILRTQILTDSSTQSVSWVVSSLISELSMGLGSEDGALPMGELIAKLKKKKKLRLSQGEKETKIVLDLLAQDVVYFLEHILPYVNFQKVATEELGADRVHIDYRYDFN